MTDFSYVDGGVLRFLTYVSCFLNVGMALILLAGMKKVHESRNQIQFSARHYRPYFTCLIISVVFLLVERNLQLFGSVSMLFDLTFPARWTLNNFFGIAFIAFYTLRVWLIHFDYTTGVAMFTRVTNIKLRAEEEAHFEWFLANKSNYGSPKYLTTFVQMLVVAITIGFLGWSIISPRTYFYVMAVVYIAAAILTMGIVKNITLMDDEFFIRRELLLEFDVLGRFYIIAGLCVCVGPLIGWDLVGLLLTELSAMGVFLMGCIATFWLMEKTALVITTPLLMDLRLKKVNGPRGPTQTEEYCKSKNIPELNDILLDKMAVATFLKHLIREVSVENLFFLSDVMHYKKSFVEEGRFASVPGFYVEMPSLLAWFAYRPDEGFVTYAWALSKAYVDNLSAFYVTAIDEDIRQRILDFLPTMDHEREDEFGPHEYDELCCMFDDAAQHVYALVKQAYARFARNQKLDASKLNVEKGSGKTKVMMETAITGRDGEYP